MRMMSTFVDAGWLVHVRDWLIYSSCKISHTKRHRGDEVVRSDLAEVRIIIR